MENRKLPEANPGYESNSHDPPHGGKKMPRHKLAEAIASSWALPWTNQWCPCVLRSLKPIEVTNYALRFGLLLLRASSCSSMNFHFLKITMSLCLGPSRIRKWRDFWQSGLVFCFALPFLFSLYHSLGTCSNSPTTRIFNYLNVQMFWRSWL